MKWRGNRGTGHFCVLQSRCLCATGCNGPCLGMGDCRSPRTSLPATTLFSDSHPWGFGPSQRTNHTSAGAQEFKGLNQYRGSGEAPHTAQNDAATVPVDAGMPGNAPMRASTTGRLRVQCRNGIACSRSVMRTRSRRGPVWSLETAFGCALLLPAGGESERSSLFAHGL